MADRAHSTSRRALLAGLSISPVMQAGFPEPAAPALPVLAAIVAGHDRRRAAPDLRDPLALIDAIEREWAIYAVLDQDDDSEAGEAIYEAAYQRRDALLDAAEALPFDTRDARHAKALALAWICFVDLYRQGATRSDYAVDGKLATDIEADMRARA